MAMVSTAQENQGQGTAIPWMAGTAAPEATPDSGAADTPPPTPEQLRIRRYPVTCKAPSGRYYKCANTSDLHFGAMRKRVSWLPILFFQTGAASASIKAKVLYCRLDVAAHAQVACRRLASLSLYGADVSARTCLDSR